MNFLEGAPFSVAEYYLGFFIVSFVILGLIVLSAFPAVFRTLAHAFRLLRARRRRQLRMLADQEGLDRAGEDLVGLVLFDERLTENQKGMGQRRRCPMRLESGTGILR